SVAERLVAELERDLLDPCVLGLAADRWRCYAVEAAVLVGDVEPALGVHTQVDPRAFDFLGNRVKQLSLEALQDVQRLGRRGGRVCELALGVGPLALLLGVGGAGDSKGKGEQQQRREQSAGHGKPPERGLLAGGVSVRICGRRRRSNGTRMTRIERVFADKS